MKKDEKKYFDYVKKHGIKPTKIVYHKDLKVIYGLVKHGIDVVESIEGEKVRKDVCLCLHCAHLNTCGIAKQLFNMCELYGLAFPVTRCGAGFKMKDKK